LRILLVDDDLGCLQSLELFLADDGYETYTATRGLEALDLARKLKSERKRIDLSILDYEMPDLTGIDTYVQLSAVLPGLEAVFVTGVASRRLELDITAVGGRALVPKPVDIPQMRGVLNAFRRERRARTSARWTAREGFGGGASFQGDRGYE